jgi:hypothetical protein
MLLEDLDSRPLSGIIQRVIGVEDPYFVVVRADRHLRQVLVKGEARQSGGDAACT